MGTQSHQPRSSKMANLSPMSLHLPLTNSYTRLPERFYARVLPGGASAPRLIKLNTALADELGLDTEELESPPGVAVLTGAEIAADSEPLALAYAGHQFGNFVPRLGDGRALLLGEILAGDGRLRDVQLKGSGRTPYSRSGDGRAALGPVLREYIVAEAMARIGIPTTRALAVAMTGDKVIRERELPGAILTRVALTHIRVGTFEYLAARNDSEGLALLTDYVIDRLYPELRAAEHPSRALLDRMVSGQAELIAQWMLIGFIHGVMNTDNMSVASETIDYGPCAFMDEYDPATVYSSIDRYGRYAFGNQPSIAQWNLARFGETLLPLLDTDEKQAVARAEEAIGNFAPAFITALHQGFRSKLGLLEAKEEDGEIAQDLLSLMHAEGSDFTLTFRSLSAAASGEEDELLAMLGQTAAVKDWLVRWRQRIANEPPRPDRSAQMNAVNPLYIPRNHLVEEAIQRATDLGDFTAFQELVAVLENPFQQQLGRERYALPPRPEERVLQTFCGT
jgi:serine/tyrosine/threonine adenylyltransferase